MGSCVSMLVCSSKSLDVFHLLGLAVPTDQFRNGTRQLSERFSTRLVLVYGLESLSSLQSRLEKRGDFVSYSGKRNAHMRLDLISRASQTHDKWKLLMLDSSLKVKCSSFMET